MDLPLESGRKYHRKDVFELLQLSPVPTGGNWFTGYHSHRGAHFVFCNIGTAGRTGHQHANGWETPTRLRWFGKTASSAAQPQIVSMIRGDEPVYLFYRTDNEEAFTFAGLATAIEVRETRPVEVTWEVRPAETCQIPEEVQHPESLSEGAIHRIWVNAYERSYAARKACLDHFGRRCAVCDLSFLDEYGELGKNYIHVHHIVPLATLGAQYRVNPLRDLRPVCPNCHAMLHRQDPPLSIDDLRAIRDRVRKVGESQP